MRRSWVLLALAFAACSNGSAIVPASFRAPVAVVPYMGYFPGGGGKLAPLLAVASSRGAELRLVNPESDAPLTGPNLAWALSVPTLQRPTFLAAGSLGDLGPDLLVVAGASPQFQVIGTWLDATAGFGVATTVNLGLIKAIGPAAQILSIATAPVPTGEPPVGSPGVAPVETGTVRLLVGLSDPADVSAGILAIVEFHRGDGGAVVQVGDPIVMPLRFSPVAMAWAPDNVHLYVATQDLIRDSSGTEARGLAELDAHDPSATAWPVRVLPARGAGTYTVAAAFIGERVALSFFTFAEPALRVYAALDPAGCGPERDIGCGIATFDPSLGGLATDPGIPGPPGWPVPTQSYRTPFPVGSQPIAMGIALPAANPGTVPPAGAFGAQVCYSPAVPGVLLPLCPSVSEVPGQPPFNAGGVPQKFMVTAPPLGQLWTSATALVTAIDGLAYVQDLGRFGPVNDVAMLTDPTTRVKAFNASSVGPAGPISDSPYFGFPNGTAALGLWLDAPFPGQGTVVSTTDALANAVGTWPGFTRDDAWLVSFQGLLPGLAQRRSVVGMSPDGSLYLAIQEAALPGVNGVLPAVSYWVPGAEVARRELGIHAVDRDGLPGDIGQFLLDVDPCPSTRPNWIPAGSLTPAYDPTKPPKAHETVLQGFLPIDGALYPGGALRLSPPSDPVLAEEYQCLQAWFQLPGNGDKVLTAFQNQPTQNDYVRGTWLRAGGMVLVGSLTGYAGRPVLDQPYWFAWADEDGALGEEELILARKARRFYYPAAEVGRAFNEYPGLEDPMQPGPALKLRVGRYCLPSTVDCVARVSPPVRDAGVSFTTQGGLIVMSRHPFGSAGGTAVTSFDKTIFPGQEYRGRVFYTTFVGDILMMIPPGLDEAQVVQIR